MSEPADQDKYDEVRQVIEMIRPAAQADGGDIELVRVQDDGEVHVRFLGECVACPSRNLTLKSGIEANLKSRVPWVHTVIAVD
ncbi:MAG: NifU family protein [Planctomycetes bacterium]|nr:NifU family protein [Planctomycetota bacterium]NOG54615.1 NifU family protein [Planctomycetota bacterium]